MLRCVIAFGLLLLSSACSRPGSSAASDGIDAHDGGETDDAVAQGLCEDNDAAEPNEVPEAASRLSWGEVSVSDDGTRHDATLVFEANMCAGEHDWYLIPMAELGFEVLTVSIDALVRGASWCGHIEGCEGAVLAAGQHNTLVIDVYDANAQVLLGGDLSTRGRVDVNGAGPGFANDLLIHVYAPSMAARYDYALHVSARSYDGGNDCEC
jgi:hypothetical protein